MCQYCVPLSYGFFLLTIQLYEKIVKKQKAALKTKAQGLHGPTGSDYCASHALHSTHNSTCIIGLVVYFDLDPFIRKTVVKSIVENHPADVFRYVLNLLLLKPGI